MRADDQKSERHAQLGRLKAWLERQRVNECFPINSWYRIADSLELGRSDTQRISEARQDGYRFDFDHKAKAYVWKGVEVAGQLELLEAR